MKRELGVAAIAMMAVLARGDVAIAAGATALALPSDVAKQGVTIYTAARYGTVEEAKAAALAGCRKSATSETLRALCKIVATFSNQCVAEALDPKDGTPGFGWAMARNSAEARRQAIANCRDTAGPDRQDACEVNSEALWCDGSAK